MLGPPTGRPLGRWGYTLCMATSKSDGNGINRERVAASVVVPTIQTRPGDRVLVCNDAHGFVSGPLRAEGCTVDSWRRRATVEHGATAWPKSGPYDAAVVRLEKDKHAFEMALHAVCSSLKTDAPLWVYGANNEGIKSAAKVMMPVLNGVNTVDTRRHCRVLMGRNRVPNHALRASIESWALRATLAFEHETIEHTVFPGVFAKGRLDPATALLVSCMDVPAPNSRVLDYACGAGVIGGWLLRRDKTLALTQLDADAVSATAAAINVPEAHTITAASLAALAPTDRFDCIVSNPPIHVGTARDYGVLRALIRVSPERLNPGGRLWLVVQRQADLGPLLEECFSSVTMAKDDGRFRVWAAH